jgi:hypothetical protein
MDLSQLIQERRNKVSALDPYQVGAMLSNQSPTAIESGLRTQIQSGNPFQVRGAEMLGDRASQIYNQRLGGVKSSILRNAIFADADRDERTAELTSAYKQKQDEEFLLEQQRKAAKKAKKKGLASGLLGTAGAIGGGILGNMVAPGIGGAAGAQIGAGFGTMLGGQ